MSEGRTLVFHTDGACSMTRQIAAGAAVLHTEDGQELGYRARFLRYVTTPIAEYVGLIEALSFSWELCTPEARVEKIVIYMDAELIVRQVTGVYACRKPLLQPLLEHVLFFASALPAVQVLEFPKGGPEQKRRWSNERADAVANECREAGHDLSSGQVVLPELVGSTMDR
jgi:ribonuclease HI